MSACLAAPPVFLSLTATEPNGEGELVRVLAQREQDAQTLERTIRVSRLTLAQSRFCGVTRAQLDAAPDLDAVLQDLIEFCENAGACITFEGAAARLALRTAALQAGLPRLPLPLVLGVDEIAAIVHPVAQPFQAVPSQAGKPVLPALREIWLRLEQDLLKLPLPLLAEMNWLLNKAEHPLKKLLKAAESEAVKNQFAENFTSGKLALEKLFNEFSHVINRLAPEEERGEPTSAPPAEPLTAQEITRLLGPGGPLAAGLKGYEERPEQLAMARQAGEALNAGQHLLVEAGTGVGKSMAYLVPAILFAVRARRPVMLSTYTKNLQAQLFFKDLPFLSRHLGVKFTPALLKGRSNYLCLRKFMYTLQESAHELDDEERAQMLPLMTWATQAESGDVAELAAFSPEQNYALWDRLHTSGEDCLYRHCPFYTRCFVYRARGLAKTANVVVLNHALVFADLNREAGALPPYNEIVFDEAHKLEDAATEHLACEVTPRRTYSILNRLFRTTPGSAAGKGLLPTLLAYLEQAKSEFPPPLLASIREHILAAMQAVQPALDGSELFFNVMRQWVEHSGAPPENESVQEFVPRERGARGAGGGGGEWKTNSFSRKTAAGAPFPSPRFSGDDRKRYSAQALRPDDAENFKQGKEAAIAPLGRLRQALSTLEEDFKEIRKRNVQRGRELSKEITAQNLFLTQLIQDIEFVVKGEEPNYVYWSERLGRRGARVVAAPLDISALLHSQLYEKKRAIILTSATLSVRDLSAGEATGLAPLGAQPSWLHPGAGWKPALPEPQRAALWPGRGWC